MADSDSPLNCTVAELHARHPETIPVFVRFRMHCTGCDVAAFETVGEALRIYNIDSEEFMRELGPAVSAIRRTQSRRRPKMSSVTDAFREHHRELSRQMSDHVAALMEARPDADPQGFVAFLQNELVPHAAGEEEQLYPLMDEIVRAHGKPTATMSIDHEYVKEYIARIAAAAQKLATAPPDRQKELRRELAEWGLQLRAIFEMHLAKEERVYLPLFEEYVAEDAQEHMLAAMHEG